MKKILIVAMAAGIAAAVVKAVKEQSTEPKPTIFEKMKEFMDSMPEDFPPRVMFDNVAAIRKNTDRMLEALEKSAAATELEAAGA